MSGVPSLDALSLTINSKSPKVCPSRLSNATPMYASALYAGMPMLIRGAVLTVDCQVSGPTRLDQRTIFRA